MSSTKELHFVHVICVLLFISVILSQSVSLKVSQKTIFKICPLFSNMNARVHTYWNTHLNLTSISLCVPVVSSNQSHGEYPDCRSERESGGEASLLVSPLVVAGIVIGLVLFLSCITIIVGSLRKDSRLRNPHLRASYGQSELKVKLTSMESSPKFHQGL